MATFQKRGARWRAIVRLNGITQSATFATKTLAQIWAKRIEGDIETGKATGQRPSRHSVRDLIEWYIEDVRPTAGWRRSKQAGLLALAKLEWSERRASALTVRDFLGLAALRRDAGAGPATIGQDFIYLRAVFKAARTIPVHVDLSAMADAMIDLRHRKAVGKASRRERRPTNRELASLRTYFGANVLSMPMNDIIDFAVLSTRRQDEITRLRWDDLDRDKGTCWVNDVKHPTKRKGNRKQFRILPDAVAILDCQPKRGPLIFPVSPRYVSKVFTLACKELGINDLHFHDLRHHGASLLFEAGYSIQEVALFTLHETWASLQRYTHLKPENVQAR